MIKNIIFDFGDIFINLDKAATLRELNKLGLSELKPELLELFHSYEKGSFSTSTFLQQVRPFFPEVPAEQLISAWNAILLDFPDYRLDFLESFAKDHGYRLFLLSNTNDLHMMHVAESLGKLRYERFLGCFESVCLSYEMMMRKPEAEIFIYMLEKFGLHPGETLFIDDTLENTLSAAALGIQVWHLDPEQEDIITLDKKLAND